MRTHRFVSLTRTNERLRLAIAGVSLILLTCLFAQHGASTIAQIGLPASQTTCTGTFAGHWSVPNVPGTSLNISVKGDTGSGDYVEGNAHRVLKGHINGNAFSGEWMQQANQHSGTFIFELNGQTMKLSFYEQKKLIESAEWSCQSLQAQASPSPNQAPSPIPNLLGRDGRDIDNFATFDALPKPEQEAMLSKRGPRVQKEYQVSRIEMRVFVKGGLPIIVDYALSSDAPASLSIGVDGYKPFVTRLEPAKLAQVRVTVPDHFGPDRQVGKLRIFAYTSRKEPANFQLYGIAFGEAGANALNNLIPTRPNVLRSVLGFASRAEPAGETLFEPTIPQDNNPVVISVSPPLTIQSPKKKPKKFITFSFTSRSLYDNGCWELLHMDAGSRSSRWQKDTGPIRPNKQKSEKWDGIISIQKLVLAGDYELRVRAWRGDASGAAVIARALSALTVIE